MMNYIMEFDHVLQPDQSAKYEGTNLFVCSGQFLHFVSRHMRKATLNTSAVNLAMYAFGHYIKSKSKEDYEDLQYFDT
jgi:hypothetical protein